MNARLMLSRLKLSAFNIVAPIPARLNYARLRPPKLRGWGSLGSDNESTILSMLRRDGIETVEWSIDPEEYQSFFARAEYKQRYPSYYETVIFEKSLEHFIAQKLLCLSSQDVYIDIGSESSPAPEIYKRLFGCRTFAQDLSYAPGVNGSHIGGNAAAMPVPDGFATKMALHCSFEHFEGNSDKAFIKECSRVLRPGGVTVIVPLYLHDTYCILTDPSRYLFDVPSFDEDALLLSVEKYANRHGRCYDPQHLRTRLIDSGKGLDMRVVHVTNYRAVDERCWARFALVMRKRAPSASQT